MENPISRLQVIAEMARVTKEGGRVVISDFETTDHIVVEILRQFLPGHDKIGFSAAELEQYAIAAHLQVESVRVEKGMILLVATK